MLEPKGPMALHESKPIFGKLEFESRERSKRALCSDGHSAKEKPAKKYSNVVVAASALTKREGLAKVCVLSCNSSKTLTLNYETNFLIKIGIFSFLIFWLPKKK